MQRDIWLCDCCLVLEQIWVLSPGFIENAFACGREQLVLVVPDGGRNEPDWLQTVGNTECTAGHVTCHFRDFWWQTIWRLDSVQRLALLGEGAYSAVYKAASKACNDATIIFCFGKCLKSHLFFKSTAGPSTRRQWNLCVKEGWLEFPPEKHKINFAFCVLANARELNIVKSCGSSGCFSCFRHLRAGDRVVGWKHSTLQHQNTTETKPSFATCTLCKW